MLSSKVLSQLPVSVRNNLVRLKAAVDKDVLYILTEGHLFEVKIPSIESMAEDHQKLIRDEENRNPGSGRQWLAILSGRGQFSDLRLLNLGLEMSMQIMDDFVSERIKSRSA